MAAPEAEVRPSRSLFPKEHGAYGQFTFPLVTALLLGRASAAAWALALAGVLGFFAHEPLLVRLGHRGAKALREDGARAARLLGALTAAALAAGIFGLLRGGEAAREGALLPGALGLLLAPLVWTRREKTLPGEALAAATLAALAAPVARAAGVGRGVTLGCWALWGVAFLLTTTGVRAVTQLRRDAAAARRARLATYALAPVALGVFAAAGAWGVARWGYAVALLPMTAVSLAATRAQPTRVRSLGWTLMAAGALTVGLLAALLRGAG
ncbi:MAG: YwiC-like family protein [Deltaproteobacteria bacterium]|nr:YwiC-like family protein [Deltaproteobacteria bacterium]